MAVSDLARKRQQWQRIAFGHWIELYHYRRFVPRVASKVISVPHRPPWRVSILGTDPFWDRPLFVNASAHETQTESTTTPSHGASAYSGSPAPTPFSYPTPAPASISQPCTNETRTAPLSPLLGERVRVRESCARPVHHRLTSENHSEIPSHRARRRVVEKPPRQVIPVLIVRLSIEPWHVPDATSLYRIFTREHIPHPLPRFRKLIIQRMRRIHRHGRIVSPALQVLRRCARPCQTMRIVTKSSAFTAQNN